jgi:hypothetical protein
VALPTPVTFRQDFPEFSSITTYPDSLINFWLGVGNTRMNPAATRWGDLFNPGLELFVAHFLHISAMNQMAANAGGIPGIQRGPVSSEQADISVSYDTSAVTLKDMGHWNLTVYGTQFQELANLVGMGPLQITPSIFPNGTILDNLGFPVVDGFGLFFG